MLLLAAAMLAACDRVTAPKALEIVDDVEQKLWRNWDPYALGQLAASESYFNVWHTLSARSTIFVSKDGETDQLDAVVIERVFVPPNGLGQRVSRRSLIAWPQNTSYGILAVTETGADESGLTAEFDNAGALNPKPTLVVPRARQEDWWLPRSGVVVIEPGDLGADCPLDNGGLDAQSFPRGRVSCKVSSYGVHVAGELVRALDERNGLLPEAMKQRHRIVVAPQRVTGIQFTVRCPPDGLMTEYGGWINRCNGSPVVFWRNNALFASTLGVDVKSMRSRNSSMIYGRSVRPGRQTRPSGSRVLRWTLSAPDGSVIERDSVIDYALTPRDRPWLDECAIDTWYGGRRQCLFPEYLHPTLRSRYRVLVLDMEDAAHP